LPSSQAFAHWIQALGASSRDDILLTMATRAEARERFAALFNRIEHFPERDALKEDARRMLNRSRERKLSRVPPVSSLPTKTQRTLRSGKTATPGRVQP